MAKPTMDRSTIGDFRFPCPIDAACEVLAGRRAFWYNGLRRKIADMQ